MQSNSRIRTLAPGVDVERIAVESHFFYDPLTGVANVVFQGMEFLLLDGAVNKMLDGREPLTTTSDAIATRMFAAGLADPVTGQDLSNVSAAGVVVYLKAVYDRLHNEAAASLPPVIA
ncbi:conserved hypothetical protein [Xanthomonas citri pv. citri]|nr:hypothetical protein [Xanthomonas citri]CEL40758.1 conserved hypothetical protein [Xanthomonas citri pv. citri]